MTVRFHTRIELAFWDLVIESLATSETTRSLVRRIYFLTQGMENHRTILAMSAMAAIGFLSGLMLFLAIQYFG